MLVKKEVDSDGERRVKVEGGEMTLVKEEEGEEEGWGGVGRGYNGVKVKPEPLE